MFRVGPFLLVLICFFSGLQSTAAKSEEESPLIFLKFGRKIGDLFAAESDRCEEIAGSSEIIGKLALKQDSEHKNSWIKKELRQLFTSEILEKAVARLATARRLVKPDLSEAKARQIAVLIHDCELTALQGRRGPRVVPLKGRSRGFVIDGHPVDWVLVLDDWADKELPRYWAELTSELNVMEILMSHELMHAMVIDLLEPKALSRVLEARRSSANDVGSVSDLWTSYWEGLAIGLEAAIGQYRFFRSGITLDAPWAQSLLPSDYGYVLERQQPVRENAYFRRIDGLPKTGIDLLRTEGFIATFIYRLLTSVPFKHPNGVQLFGWPVEELLKIIRLSQASQVVEFLDVLFTWPVNGKAAAREFLLQSHFMTFGDGAYSDQLSLHSARQEYVYWEELVRDDVNNTDFFEAFLRAKDQSKRAISSVVENQLSWLKDFDEGKEWDPLKVVRKSIILSFMMTSGGM